jgi:hypothetical protein
VRALSANINFIVSERSAVAVQCSAIVRLRRRRSACRRRAPGRVPAEDRRHARLVADGGRR